ncbi:porin [Flavobacterium sp.]|uniref:porin n=1 Tax=Flavobacterium sp. TaxID=239 RepID=UPI002CE40696|nr:porin [Flavobacterium sp.]HSD06833.1 porin [Flavobacterium sp.]
MKKILLYLTVVMLPILTFGQIKTLEENTGQQPLIPTPKLALLKDVDVIFNTRMALDNYFVDGNFTNSAFSLNQLRLEMKGKIHDKIFFRFRNRYTKIADANTVDNTIRALDLAYLVFDVTPQAKFSFGKMVGDWGGYELLTNPIEILSYNTINNTAENFLVGASFSFALEDHKNIFDFQLLNSRNKTFQDQYATNLPPGIEISKMPLVAVGNWKGHLFDSKWETTYSYSFYNDAKNAKGNFVSLGNKFKANKLVLFYDFQYSNEDLDRKGVVTNIVKSKYAYAAEDVNYIDNWFRAEYLIRPKLNLLFTVMSSNAYWNGNPDPNKKSNLLNTYGIIPTIEFSPFSDINLKFYAGYIAKKNNYSTYAQNTFGVKDGTTGQISFGIIAPLLVL